MIAPNTVVLVSQSKTVSPRSPMSSATYNDLVSETGADLVNLKTQLNRILEGITKGADVTKVWKDTTSPSTDEHGIDATALYWDSSVDTPTSIHDKVTALEGTIAAKLAATSAALVTFDPSTLGAQWASYTNVQTALVKTIESLDNVVSGSFVDGGTF